MKHSINVQIQMLKLNTLNKGVLDLFDDAKVFCNDLVFVGMKLLEAVTFCRPKD